MRASKVSFLVAMMVAAGAGCGEPGPTSEGPALTPCAGDQFVLAGTIDGWVLGEGYSLTLQTSLDHEIARTPLSGDGSFALSVPPFTEAHSLTTGIYAYPPAEGRWTYSSHATLTPAAILFTQVRFSVKQGQTNIGRVAARDVSQPLDEAYRLALYSYAAAGGVTGKTIGTSASGMQLEDSFDLTICQGWNWQLERWTNNFIFEMATPISVRPVFRLSKS